MSVDKSAGWYLEKVKHLHKHPPSVGLSTLRLRVLMPRYMVQHGTNIDGIAFSASSSPTTRPRDSDRTAKKVSDAIMAQRVRVVATIDAP